MTTNRPQPDALTTVRQRGRAVMALGSLAVFFAAGWAFWPIPSSAALVAHDPAAVPETSTRLPASRPAIDASSFAAALWREPPVAEPMGPPRPPLPALRLQLLGVRSAATGLRSAMIYDTELDVVAVVQLQEVYRGFRVVRIDREGLELDGGEHRIVLQMETDGNAQRGGGR